MAQLSVALPEKLTPREQELFEELRQLGRSEGGAGRVLELQPRERAGY